MCGIPWDAQRIVASVFVFGFLAVAAAPAPGAISALPSAAHAIAVASVLPP
jgi:hypothetical protein